MVGGSNFWRRARAVQRKTERSIQQVQSFLNFSYRQVFVSAAKIRIIIIQTAGLILHFRLFPNLFPLTRSAASIFQLTDKQQYNSH